MSSREPRPTILVGCDRSDRRAALWFAGRQAGARDRVLVVHAYELPPDCLGSAYHDRFLSDRRDRGEALLQQTKPMMSHRGSEYTALYTGIIDKIGKYFNTQVSGFDAA